MKLISGLIKLADNLDFYIESEIFGKTPYDMGIHVNLLATKYLNKINRQLW